MKQHLANSQPLSKLAASSDPMWIFDQETLAFLEVNEAAVRRYGYTREEFLSMTILDIRPVDEVHMLLTATLHPQYKGPSDRDLWRHCTKDGRVFWVEISSEELRFQGRPAEIVTAKDAAESEESCDDQPSTCTP